MMQPKQAGHCKRLQFGAIRPDIIGRSTLPCARSFGGPELESFAFREGSMARGRMLSWKISTDQRVAKLESPCARLMFTWMIAHADGAGRMRAHPAHVRATVMPLEPKLTDQQVTKWLTSMHNLGLIHLYTSDGGQYLQFSGFAKHQRLDVKGKSDLPDPATQDDTARNAALLGVTPRSSTVLEVEVEGEVEVETEMVSEADRVGVDPDRESRETFDQLFWPTYPRKVARRPALDAFLKACRSQADWDAISAGLERSIATEWADRPEDKIPHAATWLNQRRWEDVNGVPRP